MEFLWEFFTSLLCSVYGDVCTWFTSLVDVQVLSSVTMLWCPRKLLLASCKTLKGSMDSWGLHALHYLHIPLYSISLMIIFAEVFRGRDQEPRPFYAKAGLDMLSVSRRSACVRQMPGHCCRR